MADVIVIGGFAGALDALTENIASLPPPLPAAVCVVIPIPPGGRRRLPGLLTSAGTLPAVYPQNFQRLEHGHIYVAPPDHHLLIDRDRAYVWRGPKENRHRPAVNALFRSAAVTCTTRVIGVVLSGALE